MDDQSREDWLLERCCAGDREAFDELFREYLPYVYNLALRLLNDPDLAEDVAQEAFLRVYQSISRFAGQARLSTWIYRIVVNLCHDARRRAARRPQQVEPPERDEPEGEDWLERMPSPDGSPETQALAAERHRVVWEAVQRLREPFRTTLILCDLEEHAYAETAEILGVSEGTVKSRLHRARRLLRHELEPHRELFETG